MDKGTREETAELLELAAEVIEQDAEAVVRVARRLAAAIRPPAPAK